MHIILKIAIILSYCVLGAYATTDITRLLKGSDIPILASGCYCRSCGHKLRPMDQIPMISFLKNKGTCPYCSAEIPISEFIFECAFLVIPTCIAFILDFSFTCFPVNLLLYEIVKVIMITLCGKRTDKFASNLIKSILLNSLIFSMQAILFALNDSVFIEF